MADTRPRTGLRRRLARLLWPFRRRAAAAGPREGGAAGAHDAQQRAQEVLRETLTKVETVLAQAEAHLRQLLRLEERARLVEDAPPTPPGSRPDDLAGLLLQYVRHFFDLIAIENRVFEQRLAALQHAFEQMESRLVEHTNSVSHRLSVLEGVQLPLLSASARQGPPEAAPTGPRWPGIAEEPAPAAVAPSRPEEVLGATGGPLHLWPARPGAAAPPGAPLPGPAAQPLTVVIRGLPSFGELAAAQAALADLPAVTAVEVERYANGTAELRLTAAGALAPEVALEALRGALGPGLTLEGFGWESGTLTLHVG